MDDYKKRVDKALGIICSYGYEEGEHHRVWVIDQVARALTGCPENEIEEVNSKGEKNTYTKQGTNEIYLKMFHYQDDEDTIGVAP